MYNYHVRDKRREKMFETELLETWRFIGNRCVDQAISAGRNETTWTMNIFWTNDLRITIEIGETNAINAYWN